MDNLLRIGQVCNLYGISLDTLRYYDRKGLLKPVVDKDSGYRYYSLGHLDVLEMLLIGRYLEIPLDQMKEKIDLESIDGYLDVMEEQSRFIEEKCNQLRKLSLYTQEMMNLFKSLQGFENDMSFKNVVTEKNFNLTVYYAELKNLLSHEDSSRINGIEAFEQWFSYSVGQEGLITENSQTVGLSIKEHIAGADEILDYLERMTAEGKAKIIKISGNYRRISFHGKEEELNKYLYLLCSHFHLSDTVIHIKYKFALLHKDMEHEYFAEIYFYCEDECPGQERKNLL